MKKIYYLTALLLLSVQLRAQSPETMEKRIARMRAFTWLSQTSNGVLLECKHIAEMALTESPSPVAIISTEGRLKGDPVKTATLLAVRDFKKTYSLAVAFKITGEKKYLEKASAFLTAWARVNHSEGNPINDTNLDAAIDSYELLKPGLSPEAEKLIVKWLRNTAEAEINSMPLNKKKETAHNNWNSHRLKIIGQIGFAIKDSLYQHFAVNQLKKQLEGNLLPDGSSIDFELRDALHYHVYDLEPLLKLAIVIKQAGGIDFYTYETNNGSSIKKSVAWLLPYLNGTKSHEEYVHSTVEFDRSRAKNGEAAYQTGVLFKPSEGLKTIALAIYFDQSYQPLYQKIRAEQKNEADWQLLYQMVNVVDLTEK